MTSAARTVPTMTIGDRIRLARRHSGMRAQELADALAVDPNTISNYETGKTSPPNTKVRRIAELTGVDEAWLATGVASDQATSTSPWHLLGLDTNEMHADELCAA
jgi:transcriptional regulator with XRE-family HTH domain